jgi:WS/DGAT/MGAT family acyltransferase
MALLSRPGDRLSRADSIMWRIESDPVLRSPVVVVGVLDRPPDPGAFDATLSRAARSIPRLTQRIAAPPFGPPRWVSVPDFRIEDHIRRFGLPRPGDLRGVLDLAEPGAAGAFDPVRPLWELTLAEGLEAGRAAFVLRFHHSITDGIGGIDLAHGLFDRTRSGRGRGWETAHHPGPTGNGSLRPDPRDLPRLARSVAKLLAPAGEQLSPILRHRSLSRALDAFEVPLDRLRGAAKGSGATVNDAFLAAVAGALHAYHERQGSPLQAMRVTMPVSLRKPDDPSGGNRFAPARFVLPIDEPDPALRIKVVGAIAHAWRAEPALRLTDALAGALDMLPGPVVTWIFGGLLRNVDVDAVDVPGLEEPAYLAGARVDRMWAFAPPTGAALSVTLLSHAGTGCVGVVSDRAAVDDPAMLVACFRESFDEICALGLVRAAGGAGR